MDFIREGKKKISKRNFHIKTNDIFCLNNVPKIELNEIRTGKKRILGAIRTNFQTTSLNLPQNGPNENEIRKKKKVLKQSLNYNEKGSLKTSHEVSHFIQSQREENLNFQENEKKSFKIYHDEEIQYVNGLLNSFNKNNLQNCIIPTKENLNSLSDISNPIKERRSFKRVNSKKKINEKLESNTKINQLQQHQNIFPDNNENIYNKQEEFITYNGSKNINREFNNIVQSNLNKELDMLQNNILANNFYDNLENPKKKLLINKISILENNNNLINSKYSSSNHSPIKIEEKKTEREYNNIQNENKYYTEIKPSYTSSQKKRSTSANPPQSSSVSKIIYF